MKCFVEIELVKIKIKYIYLYTIHNITQKIKTLINESTLTIFLWKVFKKTSSQYPLD